MPLPPTPNMNLVLPIVSSIADIGPAWATELNTALGVIVEGHDHSAGKGARVTAAGINITSDLAFGTALAPNNATFLRSTRFVSQVATLIAVGDLSCIYVKGGDLYYNNAAGTAVQVTSGGSLNSGALVGNLYAQQAVAGNLTINPASSYIELRVDCSAIRTITLPAANGVTAGRFYIIKDVTGQSGTNAITLAPAGTDTIDGVNANVALSANYGAWLLVGNGVGAWDLMRISTQDLNGAKVPAGSGLTTGNVLRVTGSTTLGYGQVDLANTNAVVNVLPATNLGLATLSQSGAVQLANDLQGTATAPAVVNITGDSVSNIATVRCASMFFGAALGAANFGMATASGAGAGGNLTINAQSANGAGAGGQVVISGGAPAGGSARGGVRLTLSVSEATQVMVHAAEVAAGRRVVGLLSDNALTATQMPVNTGDKVIFIGDTASNPVASAVGGAILTSSAGRFGWMGTANTNLLQFDSTTDTAASAGNAGPTVPGSCQKWWKVSIAGTTYRVPMFA